MLMLDSVRQWLWSVALRKALLRAAQAAASWAVAQQAGVSVDPDKLAAVVFAGSEFARNWVKHRWPRLLSWL